MNYKRELEKKGYEIERCIDTEERYRLARCGKFIFEESANEDFCDEKVAKIFWEMLKETNEEEARVEAAISVCDNGIGYTVVNSVELPECAKLMTFVSDDEVAQSSAVVYSDGTIFFTDDWQAPYYAESYEEIELFEWHTLDGRKGVLLNGMPRVL